MHRSSIVLVLALAGSALAQPTAFTYQGRLNDGSDAANGQYDFRFRLYNAQSGGSQVGMTLEALLSQEK